MNNIFQLIDRLVKLSCENNLIDKTDEIYCRNRLLSVFKIDSYTKFNEISISLHETLDGLLNYAIDQNIIDNNLYSKDIFSSNIMNIFVPLPSTINKTFNYMYNSSPKEATDYFYNLSKRSNYIRTDRIAKNTTFKALSEYGLMEITINLSKPEKDPKQIALERNSQKSNYPTCLLCIENEGYQGNLTHPDRANHRMIRLHLNDQDWMFQYSPYLYYNEHFILLCKDHTPMTIGENTFKNLLEFIDTFPHYFIGSNADLPIVGGSILSHEHYQGGNHKFPMNSAKTLFNFIIDKYPLVQAEAIKWPLSTIRLKSDSITDLVKCSNLILETWKNYNDESLYILSNTNNESHNTITPIVRKENELFIIDLVLRNNRTSKEYPLGIFHPHQEVQHIKKENIGLIEVMGLAVLPGRLLNELNAIVNFINNKSSIAEVKSYHKDWALELKTNYSSIEGTISTNEFININLADKFVKVLEHCGVFPLTEKGINGFKKFISFLNK